jgi:Restriction endonuclease S subunits
MAKTLYDYWFVQFDFPDADGRPYKSSGGEMVFDETLKREIPKGWEVKSLGEIADLYQPATLSEKELNKNGQFLVYGANGIIGKYNKFNHENPVVAVACRGNSCGAINITQPKSWITGNAMVVNPKNKNMCIDFIKNTLLVNNLDKVVSGSAQPQITRTNFAPLKVILPSEALLKLYSDIVNSMFNKRINQIQQNAKLTQLRDFLLPMLMNGQVSVAE